METSGKGREILMERVSQRERERERDFNGEGERAFF